MFCSKLRGDFLFVRRSLYSSETLQVKVANASKALIEIEREHARKRRRPANEEQCDVEEDLICTQTPTKKRNNKQISKRIFNSYYS